MNWKHILAIFKFVGIGFTPTHRASITGRAEILRVLISNGADVNIKDLSGCTPILYACRHGHLNAVTIFLSCKDIDLDAKTKDLKTCLHIVCETNNAAETLIPIAILLLDKNINAIYSLDKVNNLECCFYSNVFYLQNVHLSCI